MPSSQECRAKVNQVDDLVNTGGTFQEFKDRAEAAFIRKQLELHGWNISRTAEALDIQRSHLYNKMKKVRADARGREHAVTSPRVFRSLS